MIIPIESSSSASSASSSNESSSPSSKTTVQEWGLVELNGELVMPSETTDETTDETTTAATKNELELGCLKYDGTETPILTLGAHELRGTMEKLKKPFAIFQKKKRKRDDDSCYYEVVGIVTKKLLFAQYPKSIMR